jgi:hypothetical protein
LYEYFKMSEYVKLQHSVCWYYLKLAIFLLLQT